MKTTGIVRGIDSLGRIVLPKELRTNMHIDKDSKLEIFVEGDQIILKKHRPAGTGTTSRHQKAPVRSMDSDARQRLLLAASFRT